MIYSNGLGLLLAAAAALAQNGVAPPSFEVASVKLAAPIASKEGKERTGPIVSGARVEINFTSLAELVRIAYRVKPYQVAGPDRTLSEHFDIQARMPEGASPEEMPEMLQTLLRERFKLTLHRERKEHAVYALSVGKTGLKLPEAPVAGAARNGSALVLNRKMTFSAFADFLGRFADRPVVDETGLTGTYAIVVEIPTDELVRAKSAAENAARSGADPNSDPAGSPMFAAARKLGLRLEPRKAPMEVLVIDHAEKLPAAN